MAGHAHLSADAKAQILRLQRQAKTHDQIAQAVGFHRATVTKFLSRWNRAALKRVMANTDTRLLAQIEQLDHIASELLEGWERSKRATERTKMLEGVVAEKIVDSLELTSTSNPGDVQFLREARNVLADLRKLTGIDRRKNAADDSDADARSALLAEAETLAGTAPQPGPDSDPHPDPETPAPGEPPADPPAVVEAPGEAVPPPAAKAKAKAKTCS